MKSSSIDNPKLNDNRNYDYSGHDEFERDDYKYIVELVKPNSSVVDLGCGNGSLLKKLIDEKKVNGQGIELSPTGVEACLKKGLKVSQGKIDEELPFKDDSFDYSICNVTIQMVMYPEILLKEMRRVSKYQIVSFPNFGFYKNRFDLFFNGRMPESMLFGYSWYSTGHIHQFSIKDFYQLISDLGGLNVEKILWAKTTCKLKNMLTNKFPNLFMAIPIFLLSKKHD